MNTTPRDARPHADAIHDKPDRGRDDAPERAPGHDGKGRIGAEQLAAPSTRRWRRAGRFAPAR